MPAPTSRPHASAWEWTQTALLAVNLMWTTLGLGGSAPEIVAITALLTGALVAVHLAARVWAKDEATVRTHPAGWLLLPFLAYAAANVAWITPVRWLGWRDWYWWAEMVAVFWVVLNGVRSPAPRRLLLGTLMALGAIMVALACYQRFVRPQWMMLGRVLGDQFIGRATGSFGLPNSLAAFLILLGPAAGAVALSRRASVGTRAIGAGLAAWFGLGVVLTISRGAWLALALAVVAWPLAAGRGDWPRRIGRAAAVFGALLAAGWALYALSPKVHERLDFLVRDRGERSRPIMWHASWRLFRESPAFGSGAGSYNVLFEKFRPEQFHDETAWTHNEYLNTLSDYGAVGFVLFFGACIAIVWRSWRCSAGQRGRDSPEDEKRSRSGWADSFFGSAWAIGILAFALQLFVEYHFKIPALALAFATVTALGVGHAWPAGTRPVGRRSPIASGAALAMAAGTLMAALWFSTAFRAEALRFYARESIDQLAAHPPATPEGYRTQILRAEASFRRAVALDPGNGRAWADLSYATALRSLTEGGNNAELGRAAEAAAERALAISQVYNEFWIRRGVARDLQGRWFDGGPDFTQAITVAPTNATSWYYYADHLSRRPAARDLMEMALAFCLRLDPGNPDGLALRQRLAISQKGP